MFRRTVLRVGEASILGGLVFWKRVFLLIEVALYSIQLILELPQLTSLRLQLFDIFLEFPINFV